jgi:hypothetical protein
MPAVIRGYCGDFRSGGPISGPMHQSEIVQTRRTNANAPYHTVQDMMQ